MEFHCVGTASLGRIQLPEYEPAKQVLVLISDSQIVAISNLTYQEPSRRKLQQTPQNRAVP